MPDDELQALRRANISRTGTLKFSKNTISVVIRDPNGPNLTFLDLPGKIAIVTFGIPYLI